MTEEEKRLHRACFTGHRPEKLERMQWLIKHDLKKEILRAIDDGITVFISGMARGVDIWAAEIVLSLRKSGKPIKLICASPFPGFEERWDKDWKDRYNAIMAAADHTVFVCKGYSRSCFQIRNEWMVDRSARVIAVYNGEPGGTKNTIDYARRQGIIAVQIKG
ncbi:MAG: DUF1273 family protein [Oscillospiraceae bacterium]|nr:DUF1273 family protein [Oscillospiraceae bacterium]